MDFINGCTCYEKDVVEVREHKNLLRELSLLFF